MKKSITLISTFTVLISLLLMVPIVIPQNTVSAAVADTVTLNNLKYGPCGTWGIPAYVKSGGSLTCNMTISSDAAPGFIDAKCQLFAAGSSEPIWQSDAFNAIYVAAIGDTTATVPFTMPAVSLVAAGTYDIRVGAQPNGADAWKYSAKRVGGIIITNTTPTAPTLVTPLNNTCVNTQTPTFSWNTASGAATYTLVIDGTDNQTCLTGTSIIAPAMTEATHTWAIRAVGRSGNTATSVARTVCIDISPPTQPAGLTSLSPTGGYNPTYTWTASTDNSACANIQYIVTTYNSAIALVDNVTVSTPSYTRSTLFGGGDHTWYVLPFDCAGNFGTIAGPGRFTMPTVTTTYSIPLSVGWNLISLPLIPANTAIGTVLSSTNIPGNKVVSVWYLDYGTSCSSPTFKWYKPGNSASTLATMEAGKAYWISCNQTGTLSGINARPCPAVAAGAPPAILQYQLCYNAVQDGWNMLGFKCTQSMLASDYLSGVVYSSLYRYAGGWAPVDASSDNLTPGTGYYIRMTGSGKITPPCY